MSSGWLRETVPLECVDDVSVLWMSSGWLRETVPLECVDDVPVLLDGDVLDEQELCLQQVAIYMPI